MGGRSSGSGFRQSRNKAGQAASTDARVREALDALNALGVEPRRGRKINPINGGEVNFEEANEIQNVQYALENKYGSAMSAPGAEIQSVPIDSLISTQYGITPDAAARYIRQLAGAGSAGESGHGYGEVSVIRHDGKLWLVDGNHRAAAAKLLGMQTITARVVDADALGIDRALTRAYALHYASGR